jgi:hypothetical protein
MSTRYRYVGPGRHYGTPARDVEPEEYRTLSPRQQRILRESPAYEAVDLDDPLGELSNAQFEKLSPAEKGQRTKESNRRAEEAAAAATAEAGARAEEEEAKAQVAANAREAGDATGAPEVSDGH